MILLENASAQVGETIAGGIPLTSIRALHLLPLFRSGKVAQLVEQRTENPCVPGSIPGLATIRVYTKDWGGAWLG